MTGPIRTLGACAAEIDLLRKRPTFSLRSFLRRRLLVVLVLFSTSGLAGPLPPETQVNPGAGAGPAAEGVRCKGQPEGASCWMELTNHPGCYVWINHYQPDETVTWTSECAEGLAQGTGTLTEDWDGDRKTKEKTGSLVDGKAQGRWVYRDQDGTVAEGSYEAGKRHGHWVERLADGTVQEGSYESGKRQGQWELRFASGTVIGRPVRGRGTSRAIGLLRFASGTVRGGAGPLTPGFRESSPEEKRQGRWVLRFHSGTVMEGPFVAGQRQGHWVERYADGGVQEGPYEAGKRQGHWVERYADGDVLEGAYEAGKEQGRWVAFGGRGRTGRPV